MVFPASKADLYALAGIAGIIGGSFAPAADVALYGSVSYWDAAGPEAAVMIAAGLGAVVCLALRRPGRAKLFVVLMWAALLWPYLQGLLEPAPEGFLEEAAATVVDTTTGWATDIALHFVDITWGMGLLLLGCLGVTLGTFRRP